jgi:hypothetical protein
MDAPGKEACRYGPYFCQKPENTPFLGENPGEKLFATLHASRF